MRTVRWVPAVAVLISLVALTDPTSATTAATATVAPAQHLAAPGCTTAVAAGSALPVSPVFASVPGLPFDVETTPDGRFTFVSSQGVGQSDHSGGGAILVYRGDGALGSPVHTVDLGQLVPGGMAFADGGRILLVAAGTSLVVLDVAAAEHGAADAVASQVRAEGTGAIEVARTPDGRFAFVTMEDNEQVDVFRLAGEHQPSFVGAVPVGREPVGVAFSPDGKTAYVTSEIERGTKTSLPGTLSLVRVAVAERTPSRAVENTVLAGCQPVRVVVSGDGAKVWVTARGSDAVLGFSARALARGAHALTSDVTVGAAPVGLVLFDSGRRLLVADSNRFTLGSSASLAVLTVAGAPALLGYVPSGFFPRQMVLAPGGKSIDVANYQSSQVETVLVPPLVAATG